MFKDESRKEFIEPTSIYWDVINELREKINVNGLMHITGGAFTKIKGILPKNADAIISNPLKPDEIFIDIYNKGLSDEIMYKTFNCSNGFVISVNDNDLGECLSFINNKFSTQLIGEVIKGDGNIVINSKFSDKSIIY